MSQIYIFLLCIIPIIILLSYVYINDKIEKEPFWLLILLFIGGLVSCLVSIFISNLLKQHINFLNWQYNEMNIFQTIFKSLVTIALIEESTKWIINYVSIWKNKNFNHIYDPIVYCVFVSLGFALLENIIYTITFSNYGLMPTIMRGLISVPSHAVFGIFMGFYLGISKNALIYGKKKQSNKYKLLSLIIPIGLHFIYNLFLIENNFYTNYLFILYLILLYISAIIKIKKLSKIHQLLKENDTLN